MTEDINELQGICLKDGLDARSLFIIGNILEIKKPYMDDGQRQVQLRIESLFKHLRDVKMGYTSPNANP